MHRRHRDVIFGKTAIEIIANKLPDSYKMYLTRHNDELKKNAQAIRLAQARTRAKYALDGYMRPTANQWLAVSAPQANGKRKAPE